MAYYFVAQKFRIRLFQSETIVFFFSAPVFQCDDQIDILCLPDALHTKHGLHIYDSNTTKLDKMSGDIRCRTNQRIIADLTDLYHVICYQTMSSLDQLQRCLAELSLVWNLADLFMGFLCLTNLYAVARLSKYARIALFDYVKQKKQGIEEPVFDPAILGDERGVYAWGVDRKN